VSVGVDQPGHNKTTGGINGFYPNRNINFVRNVANLFNPAVLYSDHPPGKNIKRRINGHNRGIIDDGVKCRLQWMPLYQAVSGLG